MKTIVISLGPVWTTEVFGTDFSAKVHNDKMICGTLETYPTLFASQKSIHPSTLFWHDVDVDNDFSLRHPGCPRGGGGAALATATSTRFVSQSLMMRTSHCRNNHNCFGADTGPRPGEGGGGRESQSGGLYVSVYWVLVTLHSLQKHRRIQSEYGISPKCSTGIVGTSATLDF